MNMKKIFTVKVIRSIALMMTFVFMIICIGCSGGSQKDEKSDESKSIASSSESSNSQSGTVEEKPGDGLPETDLGGYVYKVADFAVGRWKNEEGLSDFADKINERIKYVENRFNCKIDVVETDAASFFELVQPAIMAGDKFADIIIPTIWGFGKFVSADILTDLKTVPHLKLDQPHWNQNSIGLTSLGGKVYGAANYFTPHVTTSWGLYYNKEMIKELGLEDPFKLVKENKWTFDKFREYALAAMKDLNGDGVMDHNDRYGLSGPEQDMTVAFFLGMGQNALKVDENGKVVYSMNDPKVFDVLGKLRQMFHQDKLFYVKKAGESWLANVDAFVTGKSLFLGYMYGMQQLRDMEDDFGYLPMPTLEESGDYRCAVDHNSPLIGIPITNSDLEKTGLITEALAWKAQEDMNILFDDAGSTFFRDEDSAAFFRVKSKHLGYDIFFMGHLAKQEISLSTVYQIVICTFMDNPSEPASSISSVAEVGKISVDEFYNLKK